MGSDATTGFAPYHTPTPALRPRPRLRRGRSKTRAPVARKPCLFCPAGRGALTLGTSAGRELHSPALRFESTQPNSSPLKNPRPHPLQGFICVIGVLELPVFVTLRPGFWQFSPMRT
ncbi:hypothetical protein FQJ87_09585, partial [Xanthomonas vasicola]